MVLASTRGWGRRTSSAVWRRSIRRASWRFRSSMRSACGTGALSERLLERLRRPAGPRSNEVLPQPPRTGLEPDVDRRKRSPPIPRRSSSPAAASAPKGVQFEHGMFNAQVDLIRDFYNIQPGESGPPPAFRRSPCSMPRWERSTVIPDMDPTRPGAGRSAQDPGGDPGQRRHAVVRLPRLLEPDRPLPRRALHQASRRSAAGSRRAALSRTTSSTG